MFRYDAIPSGRLSRRRIKVPGGARRHEAMAWPDCRHGAKGGIRTAGLAVSGVPGGSMMEARWKASGGFCIVASREVAV